MTKQEINNLKPGDVIKNKHGNEYIIIDKHPDKIHVIDVEIVANFPIWELFRREA